MYCTCTCIHVHARMSCSALTLLTPSFQPMCQRTYINTLLWVRTGDLQCARRHISYMNATCVCYHGLPASSTYCDAVRADNATLRSKLHQIMWSMISPWPTTGTCTRHRQYSAQTSIHGCSYTVFEEGTLLWRRCYLWDIMFESTESTQLTGIASL
jgi:hypothetical protein